MTANPLVNLETFEFLVNLEAFEFLA
jgi:hypothetical protein